MSFLSQNKTFKRNWNWIRPAPSVVPPTTPVLLTTSADFVAFLSTDLGVTWTPDIGNFPFENSAVAWTGTEWIVAGSFGGGIARSTDGLNWTLETGVPAFTDALDIRFGNGLTVVSCGPDGVLRSPAVNSWTLNPVDIGDTFGAIWDGSNWFAVGSTALSPLRDSAVSADAITWTPQANFYTATGSGARSLRGIVSGSSVAVVGGSFWNASGQGIWARSTPIAPGFWATFAETPNVSALFGRPLTDGATTFVVLGGLTGLGCVATSSDNGATWTGVLLPENQPVCGVYAGGFFIVIMASGNVYRSTDGLTWSLDGNLASAGWIWGGKQFATQVAAST